jgi:tol-pal system protein YbgF
LIVRAFPIAVLAATLSLATSASGQDGGASAGGLLDRIFGTGDRATSEERVAQAQASELIVRIDRLEAQIRQLTGTIEQLQYRNQQLEAQIRRMEGGGAPVPPQAATAPTRPPVASAPVPAPPTVPPSAGPAPVPIPPAPIPGRRSDVFDPTLHPNAPGAPQNLGSVPPGSNAAPPPVAAAEPPVGAPGGRNPGQPLDLSTLASGIPASDRAGSSALPPPPARNPSATGTVAAVQPASDTARGYYDLAYGYVLRKDYAFAEDAFQTFLRKYPNDTLVPDAQFWLGESLFQRQQYDTAAEQFLAVSTKHEAHPKAADALLRLGQSLAQLNQKEMACATLAEVGRKYPRASSSVKQGVDREQKRVRC